MIKIAPHFTRRDSSNGDPVICMPICLGVTVPMLVDSKEYYLGQAIVAGFAIGCGGLVLLLSWV